MRAMSATSDTPLCQTPCRGFSYQAAASSDFFQVAIPLAFSHQRVTICFSADIRLQALLSFVHNICDAVQTSSSPFLLVHILAVLYLGWNTPCMVMSFLVPMSASFRSSRLQPTSSSGVVGTDANEHHLAFQTNILD